jgi:DNA polymerase III alpha subunit (gram-positive type)
MILSNDLVFLDTETTGLTMDHDIWEIAMAVGESPVWSVQVPHSLRNADKKALELNGYFKRFLGLDYVIHLADIDMPLWLEGKTIVGANPSFDMYRLEKRWGRQTWHYRMVDVESMALPVFDLDKPVGLKGLVDRLQGLGYDVPENDHSAAGDVETTRCVYRLLRELGRERK